VDEHGLGRGSVRGGGRSGRGGGGLEVKGFIDVDGRTWSRGRREERRVRSDSTATREEREECERRKGGGDDSNEVGFASTLQHPELHLCSSTLQSIHLRCI